MNDSLSQDSTGTMVQINGEQQCLDSPLVMDLLKQQGVREARGIALAINGTVLPHDQWPIRQLNEGDVVDIVKVMVGG